MACQSEIVSAHIEYMFEPGLVNYATVKDKARTNTVDKGETVEIMVDKHLVEKVKTDPNLRSIAGLNHYKGF